MVYDYKGKTYPGYLKEGNAQKYISAIAQNFCRGNGLDVGGTKNWFLDGAEAINKNEDFHAYNLPNKTYDYIFSSHTLEHLTDYVKAIEIWTDHIKDGGVLFLYLPHPEMEYWLPQNNRKHLHIFHPKDVFKLLKDLGYKNVFNSERDLFYSFAIVGVK